VHIHFDQAATPANPAAFCLRNYDFNVFSMSLEEYRQKPSYREDGVDYAEKYIDVAVDRFSLMIHFPAQMCFAQFPSFAAYRHRGAAEIRDDKLNKRVQQHSYYSPLLNTAILEIANPPLGCSYRIFWHVREADQKSARLTATQRKRQRLFAQKLLKIRALLNKETPPDSKLLPMLEPVFKVLASYGESVRQMLQEGFDAGEEVIAAADLDLSIMVLDDSGSPPMLRTALGTGMDSEQYRNIALFVGDGNAGRAWKRRMARVFDRAKAEEDLRFSAYVDIPGLPMHEVLFSIPLIDPDQPSLLYGILNIGTFKKHQADDLRVLDTPENIERLTNMAQAYVLKRLREIVKI
jgi:hypothetical protein